MAGSFEGSEGVMTVDELQEDAMRVREAQVGRGYVVEKLRLRILRELTEEETSELGRYLAGVYKSYSWAIGDWLVHVEGLVIKMGRPGLFDVTGTIYEKASALTGLSRKTLYRFARCAQEWSYETRVENYDLRLHEHALKLPNHLKRVRILREAAEKKWSPDMVVEEIDRHMVNPPTWPSGKQRGSVKSRVKKEFACPHCSKPIDFREAKRLMKEAK